VSDKKPHQGHRRLKEAKDEGDPNAEPSADAGEADADRRCKVRQSECNSDQQDSGHRTNLSPGEKGI